MSEKEHRRRFRIVLAMMEQAGQSFEYLKPTKVAEATGASLPTARKMMEQAALVIGLDHMTWRLITMLEGLPSLEPRPWRPRRRGRPRKQPLLQAVDAQSQTL